MKFNKILLSQENVHELDAKQLKERSVVKIDIANDPVDANDYKQDEDPKIYKSEKTGRGPLSGNWQVDKLFSNKFLENFQLENIFCNYTRLHSSMLFMN